eukprot:13420139-Alexandrium_andersonii.AAC.1
MVSHGWAVRREDLDGLRAAHERPINRLAPVTRVGPDNALKHRVVWDLRRSPVNGLVRQGER